MTSIEKLVQDAPPAPFIDDIGAHMTGASQRSAVVRPTMRRGPW